MKLFNRNRFILSFSIKLSQQLIFIGLQFLKIFAPPCNIEKEFNFYPVLIQHDVCVMVPEGERGERGERGDSFLQVDH